VRAFLNFARAVPFAYAHTTRPVQPGGHPEATDREVRFLKARLVDAGATYVYVEDKLKISGRLASAVQEGDYEAIEEICVLRLAHVECFSRGCDERRRPNLRGDAAELRARAVGPIRETLPRVLAPNNSSLRRRWEERTFLLRCHSHHLQMPTRHARP
jgi:hypothetical protein